MKRKSNFIDFLDDLINTCIYSLHYILYITGERYIASIIPSLEYAGKGLEKLFEDYSKILKGGEENEK